MEYEIFFSTLKINDENIHIHGWSEAKIERLKANIRSAEYFYNSGSLPLVKYKDLRSFISSGVEDATSAIIGRYTNCGRWEQMPREVYDFASRNFGITYVHLVPGKIKLLNKTKLEHPLLTELLNFFTEILPLSEMIIAMKDITKKREPKAKEDLKETYSAPKIVGTSLEKVKNLLMEITQKHADAIFEQYKNLYQYIIDHYMAEQTQIIKQDKKLSPYDFYCPRNARIGSPEKAQFVYKVTKQDRKSGHYVTTDETAALIAAEAQKDADFVQERFVYKNLKKIASIVDAKKNYTDAVIVSHGFSLEGLEGAVRFTFADGSSFVVYNKVVYVENSYGTQFLRFPLTFHEVVMPDGKPMSVRVNEKNMNEVFAIS